MICQCRILDNLPVAVVRQRRDGSQTTTYEHGFRVGFKGNYAGVSSSRFISHCLILWLRNLPETFVQFLHMQSKEEKYFIHNHLSFKVMYHKDPETDSARIVGFEVSPNRCVHNCLVFWILLFFLFSFSSNLVKLVQIYPIATVLLKFVEEENNLLTDMSGEAFACL